MGFFSWLTADTGESISNRFSHRPLRTIYLLQPGQTPIAEPEYEGYGTFGGVDAFEWLATNNLDPAAISRFGDGSLREAGCALLTGYYVDTADGSKHAIFHPGSNLIDPAIAYHPYNYGQVIPRFGMTGNELTQSSRLKVERFPIPRPLKFSFNPNARYEDLPASPNCPDQGFFYDDELEEEAA